MEAVTAGVYDRPTGGLEGERGTIRSTMRCAPVNPPAVSVFPIRGLGITLASQAGGKENRPAVCQIAGRILGGENARSLYAGRRTQFPEFYFSMISRLKMSSGWIWSTISIPSITRPKIVYRPLR